MIHIPEPQKQPAATIDITTTAPENMQRIINKKKRLQNYRIIDKLKADNLVLEMRLAKERRFTGICLVLAVACLLLLSVQATT